MRLISILLVLMLSVSPSFSTYAEEAETSATISKSDAEELQHKYEAELRLQHEMRLGLEELLSDLKISRLERRIQQLERRVESLERNRK